MPDMDIPTRTPIYDVHVWLPDNVEIVVRKHMIRSSADEVLASLLGNLTRGFWYGEENNSVVVMNKKDSTHFLNKNHIIRACLVRSTKSIHYNGGYGYGYWHDEEIFLEDLEDDCA